MVSKRFADCCSEELSGLRGGKVRDPIICWCGVALIPKTPLDHV
jgi:hypothetical protein